MEYAIISDEEQQHSLRLKNQHIGVVVMVTLVYAKYNQLGRLQLWESLGALNSIINKPFLVGRDFNVIRHEEEKLGGLPVTFKETGDFNHCINTCNLEEIAFKRSKFTWWNGREDGDCIFKRLYRVFSNDKLQEIFHVIDVENLVRSGSNHAPTLLYCNTHHDHLIKLFRFLNFWLKEESCLEVIKQNWKVEVEGNPFINFYQKLKKTKVALTQLSKQTFGNIFQEIATLEELIKVTEKQFEEDPTGDNRVNLFKAQEVLAMQLKREKELWRQKKGFEWFKDGERNTRFFHAIVKGRRSRVKIKKIQNDEGIWLENQDEITEASTMFYQNQFQKQEDVGDFTMLDVLPSVVTEAQNAYLKKIPTIDEVKVVVIGLNKTALEGQMV
ncbi:uncharacterized protein LOC107846332 [Capsicum annuum]|uniref:uncharacterized protein LOC107846332 n=1 Tax=Capsicum annuum TaxID=4072 RepID=UPI0007BF40F2|nr:uncharacterized protein LOC107846332 [Capsicum annuum]